MLASLETQRCGATVRFLKQIAGIVARSSAPAGFPPSSFVFLFALGRGRGATRLLRSRLLFVWPWFAESSALLRGNFFVATISFISSEVDLGAFGGFAARLGVRVVALFQRPAVSRACASAVAVAVRLALACCRAWARVSTSVWRRVGDRVAPRAAMSPGAEVVWINRVGLGVARSLPTHEAKAGDNEAMAMIFI